LDWLEAREKKLLRRLERLVRRNQVEILSGGYYEPILPLIPERDAVRQLRHMNEYIERRFGQIPTGFWLTERVWEQKIPRLAREAGLEYTILDDTHFALAGLTEAEIRNFFITEEEGSPLIVFPIPQFLRYVIPFREPDETLAFLKGLSSETEEAVAIAYADDGEKFGLWPGTYQWVYREGWLERFARALEENQSWLTLKTFREVIRENQKQPLRKIYLSSASYEEMSEWALSRAKSREFLALRKELEQMGTWNRARIFLQGGTFKNFLVKYPEADWMRSRMQRASRIVAKERNPQKRGKAERELWQGQCNCPYWHGVFGGIYLHHLRRSTYGHLIRAEQICRNEKRGKTVKFAEEDLNQDGVQEIIVECPPFSLYFLPHRGGAIAEVDFAPEQMNVLDILARREEAYHQDIVRIGTPEPAKGKSIHDLEKNISRDVIERAAFDTWERFSLIEQFYPPETSLEDVWRGRANSLAGDPTRSIFSKNWKKSGKEGKLQLTGHVWLPLFNARVAVCKAIRFFCGLARFEIEWKLTNDSARKIDFLWGSEWNFNFYDRQKHEKDVTQFAVQDGWSPVQVEISGKVPFDCWQFPIETISRTESDYRLIHQGISVFPHWKLSLKPRETFKQTLTFNFLSRQ